MGGIHSKKSHKHKRTKEGRATEREADDNLCVLGNSANHNSSSVFCHGFQGNNSSSMSREGFQGNTNNSSSALPDGIQSASDYSNGIAKTDYFVIEAGGIKDRDIIELVSSIARQKGPQPVGYSTIISGVKVLWSERPARTAPCEILEALGGDPPRSRSTPLEKVVNPQGNNPHVRALYPRIQPPAEPRA
ncbi:hypothetical protein V1264_000809 [Littorina saxatilis]|uniref:Uncharacterized protein n=1 Tax=Littorina saxatilis TaxID=31220 RepID=A0AAN9C029_9CAEN